MTSYLRFLYPRLELQKQQRQWPSQWTCGTQHVSWPRQRGQHCTGNTKPHSWMLLADSWRSSQPTYIGAPNAPPITQKLSYTSALTEGTQRPTQVGTTNPHPPSHPRPHPVKRFDITLVQKSRDSSVFTELSNKELIGKIPAAL